MSLKLFQVHTWERLKPYDRVMRLVGLLNMPLFHPVHTSHMVVQNILSLDNLSQLHMFVIAVNKLTHMMKRDGAYYYYYADNLS